MMTRHDLGGRRRKELRKGSQGEVVAPNSISLFKRRAGNLVALNAAQLFQYTSSPGKEQRKGTYEKKNEFDIQASWLREVTSSRPFQKTRPPGV